MVPRSSHKFLRGLCPNLKILTDWSITCEASPFILCCNSLSLKFVWAWCEMEDCNTPKILQRKIMSLGCYFIVQSLSHWKRPLNENFFKTYHSINEIRVTTRSPNIIRYITFSKYHRMVIVNVVKSSKHAMRLKCSTLLQTCEIHVKSVNTRFCEFIGLIRWKPF